MNYQNIIYEKTGNVAVITMNQPNSMNAISAGLMVDLESAFSDIEAGDDVRALIITGGEKVFAAGANIKELNIIDTPVAAHGLLKKFRRCFDRLTALDIPVIAAVSGFAFGAGCELALACDIRIASETALFGLPEITLGLMPGAGGTQRLPRLIGMGRAYEILFSGKPVKAQRAFEMGLVNDVWPENQLLEKAMILAAQMAKQPAFSANLIKTAVKKGMDMELSAALDYEARCFEILFSTHDQKEGTAAFVEKRKPDFKGY